MAIEITAHKTRAVFERYNIVDPRDLIDAAKKIEAAHDKSQISENEQPQAEQSVTIPQVG